MNKKKAAFYNYKLLENLLSNEVVTIMKLSDQIGLSEKTVRNKINQLNIFLEENDLGIIEKQKGIGIWLEASMIQKEKLNAYMLTSHHISYSYEPMNREKILVKLLLKNPKNDIVTTSAIANQLFISIPTALNIVKDCSYWFEKYNIDLRNIRNKGIQLVTSENAYRLAVKDFIVENLDKKSIESELKDFAPGVDISRISIIIKECEKVWRLTFAEKSFNEILIFVSVAISRNRKCFEWDIVESEEYLQQYNEYSLAIDIFKRISHQFNVEISQEDISFLAMHILCSRLLEGKRTIDKMNYMREYDRHLCSFVEKMVETVGKVLNVNLSNDLVLKERLLVHMRPTIFRLRYGRQQSEEMVQYIKNEYQRVYRATWSISPLLEEYYGLSLTENELIYITLYFQLALERCKMYLNTILVTNLNMAYSQLICKRIRGVIPYLQDIKCISTHEFQLDYYGETQLIITNTKLNIKDHRLVEIDNILSENSIQNLKQKSSDIIEHLMKIEQKFDSICYALFDPELIFLNLTPTSKEDLLEEMVLKLSDKGYVSENYLTSVFERERATTTNIGGNVAIPHGNISEVNESKVAIAVLDKPIFWGDEMVDIIFLLAFKVNTPNDISRTQQFYKYFIRLTESKEDVALIKNMRNPLELYRFLIK